MAKNSIIEQWLETDVMDRVVDMIIYTGLKDLAEAVEHWPDEWMMYRNCVRDLNRVDWLTLKKQLRRVLK